MPRLSLKLIGPFRAELDGTAITGFNSDKTRALLAYLALEHDRPHRRESLAALLWPDVPEASARQSLSQSLSNLRRILREADTAQPYLLATPDAVQFNRAAARALDIDDMQRAGGDLPRGTLLEGLSIPSADAFEEWLLLKRESVQRATLAALDRRIRDAFASSAFDAAAAAARHQLELDPWHEPAHRHLMRALALGGDRAGALAQYERCAQILRAELGIDPGPETVALAEEVRRGVMLTAGVPNAPAMPANLALPNPLTPFIGRAHELIELGALLANPDARLITIAGLGGMGKTRLAIEAARLAAPSFGGRVHFVPLAAATRAEQIVPAIAATLDWSLSNQGDPMAQLVGALRGDPRLLILDNIEQLLSAEAAATTGVITTLLHGAAALRLLLTSRAALQAPGEWLFRLDGLAGAQDAAALFLQSARRARPSMHLTDADRLAVERICRLVDGMPLGIELAAAWSSVLSLDEIAHDLTTGSEVLSEPQPAHSERHRSITTVLDHSWAMLGARERDILAALSTFRGSFSRDMARHVAGASLAALSQLVAQSLLRRGDGGRYGLHELVRQYAAARLAESKHAAEAHRRHAETMLSWVEAADGRLYGAGSSAARRDIEAELGDIRAAWEWACGSQGNGGDDGIALALAAAMARFWYLLPNWREGKRWLDTALAHSGRAGDAHTRARAEIGLGILEAALSNETAALALFFRALPVFRVNGDRWRVAWTLCQIAHCHFALEQVAQAEAASRESLAEFSAIGDAWASAFVTWQLADLASVQNDLAAAGALALDAHTRLRALGDDETRMLPLLLLGDIALREGQHERAIACYRDCLAISRAAHNDTGTAWSLQTLGQAHLLHGALDTAEQHFGEALALREAMGDHRASSEALHGLAICAFRAGRFARAAELHDAARQRHPADPFSFNAPMAEAWGAAASAIEQSRSLTQPRLFR